MTIIRTLVVVILLAIVISVLVVLVIVVIVIVVIVIVVIVVLLVYWLCSGVVLQKETQRPPFLEKRNACGFFETLHLQAHV